MKKYKGETGLMFTTMIWGTGFIACDILLRSMSSFRLLAERFVIAALIMSVLCLKRIKHINKSTVIWGLMLGIPLYAAFALQVTGLKYSTPSKNAFLTTLHVIIVPFISFAVFRKKADFFSIAGAVLAFFGAGVLSFNADFSVNKGDALTALSAVLYAVHIFFLSEASRKKDAVILTAFQLAMCAALATVVALFTDGAALTVFNPQTLPLILYLALVCTALCFFLQAHFQKYTSEITAAIIFTLEGVFSSVYSVALGIEDFSFKLAIGSLLILAGGIIAQTKLAFIKSK